MSSQWQGHSVYQPIVDGTGRIRKLEALFRFRDTSIAVEAYVKHCEQNRPLWVPELDCQMIDSALYGLSNLLPYLEADIQLAINLSPLSLIHGAAKVIETLESLAAAHAIPLKRLEIELLETTVDPSRLRYVAHGVDALRSLGVSVVLDDFGAYNASLERLIHCDFHGIKLDDVFVHTLHSERTRTILKHMICMASDMGMSTVAEKVETEQQMTMLQEFGCDLFQGYLFYRPMPWKELALILAASRKSELQDDLALLARPGMMPA